ncbi:MAG: hypothetical protein ISR77_24940 [Pirellulaceae bacterium]|nr:hypothetical protein [Pirellulaceae bacterium]
MKYCFSIVAALLFSCTAFAQEPFYLGDAVCSFCHPDTHADYMQTGHPWKLVATNRADPPAGENADFGDPLTYPWGVPLPDRPDGVVWGDVDYIQGNFSSGHGYLIGDHYPVDENGDPVLDGDGNPVVNEGYNINRGFSYSRCVKCHVTGYDPEGGETNGITGTWDQPGIRCEECHGPQGGLPSHFVQAPDLDVARNACVRCHYGGDDVENIDFNPATMHFGHHPQAEQWLASPHYDMVTDDGERHQCAVCHNQHRSTFFNDQYPEGEGGIKRQCVDCHQDKEGSITGGMADLECKDCHMAAGHTHIFRITHEPIAAADNLDENGFWNKDENGQSFLTLDLACLGCHSEEGESFPLTLEEAAEDAHGIHAPPLPPGDTWVLDIPFRYMYDQAIVTFTPYVSILKRVETMYPDGTIVQGMGFEVNGIVYWWNLNPYSVFYGRINRAAGTMSGIVISRQGVAIWNGGQP